VHGWGRRRGWNALPEQAVEGHAHLPEALRELPPGVFPAVWTVTGHGFSVEDRDLPGIGQMAQWLLMGIVKRGASECERPWAQRLACT
jgi:hypothetical protein